MTGSARASHGRAVSIEKQVLPTLTVDPREGTVTGPRGTVRLEPKVMAVLTALAGPAGQVVSRSQLLNSVWPETVVSEYSLSRCIYQLRHRLREVGADPDVAEFNPIETLPKRGYRLLMPVRMLPADPAAHEAHQEAGHQQRPDRSIAVLPFVDMSAQNDQEYLGDGIAEELINGLAKLGHLRVAARTSSFHFKGRNEDIRSIGDSLGVSAVLEGSVRKSGNRLRITAQLIDVSDASHMWSDSYDRELSDIFALQDDVAGKVIDALRVELKSDASDVPRTRLLEVRLMDVGTRSSPAYDNYLLGIHQLRKITESGYRQAITYFEQAIENDPEFAKPYACLGWSCTHLMGIYGTSPEEMGPKAKHAFARAEALGYQDALYPWDEIHRMVDPREHPADEKTIAMEAIDKLSSEDPSGRYFEYCQIARSMTKVGLFDAALDFYELYLTKGNYALGEVVPVENEIRWVLMALGRYEEAIDAWTDWIELEPDDPMHRAERSYLYSRRKQYAQAELDLAVVSATWRRSFARFYFFFCKGELDAAWEHFRLLEQNPNTWLLFKAYGRLLLGDIEKGLGYLEEMARSAPTRTHKGRDRNWPVRLHLQRFCPAEIVEIVNRNPRYQAMLDAMGLNRDWCDELIDQCNRLSDVTGIRVGLDKQPGTTTPGRPV